MIDPTPTQDTITARLEEAIEKSRSNNGDYMFLGAPDQLLVDCPAALSERATLKAEMEEARGVLEPFARVASTFDFAIGPDGIDDGLTVLAHTFASPEYEAVLCTSHFSAARAHLTKEPTNGR